MLLSLLCSLFQLIQTRLGKEKKTQINVQGNENRNHVSFHNLRTAFSFSFRYINASIIITFNHLRFLSLISEIFPRSGFLMEQFKAKRMQFIVLMWPIKNVVVSHVAQWSLKTCYLLMELSPEK